MKFYLKYGALISPLGKDVESHFNALLHHESGIQLQNEEGFDGAALYLAKINWLTENRYNTLLSKICDDLLVNLSSAKLQSPKTAIILSTTKANMDDVDADSFASSRQIISEKFQNPNETIILSNACISGVLAINLGVDYIRMGTFDEVVVIGIDVLNDFVVNGFQSLRALSDEPCEPFDENRKGVSLGEACGAILVSNKSGTDFSVEYLGGASSNDANHISGPSRTGEGLVRVVNKTLDRSNIKKEEINYISAHGTATLFNDEMEAIGFNRLGLENVPINSFKGNFGHTLGAAGIVEVLMCMLSMEKNTLFKTVGFDKLGTTVPLNVLAENKELVVHVVLKTASGFGGGNAALLMRKVG